MPRSNELLFKLLELWTKEEQNATDSHQKITQFYASFISAALAATIAGAMAAKTPMHFLLLLVAPALVRSISKLAIIASERQNKRFIEAITSRAKLEQALGLCVPIENENKSAYWLGESFIAPRHLGARLSFQSSQEFVDNHMQHGLHAPARELFSLFIKIAWLLAFGLLCLAAYYWYAHISS